MENNFNTDTFDNDYKMLKYFQDEFIYRHQNFWKLCNRFFVLTVAIIILPLVSDLFGLSFNDSAKKLPLLLFPVVGIFVACITFLVLQKEGKWIREVNAAKVTIGKRMHSDYQYPYLLQEAQKQQDKTNKIRKFSDIKQWFLHKTTTLSIPFAIFSIEFLLAVTVIVVLCANHQGSSAAHSPSAILHFLPYC